MRVRSPEKQLGKGPIGAPPLQVIEFQEIRRVTPWSRNVWIKWGLSRLTGLVGERGFEPPTPWSRNSGNRPSPILINEYRRCSNRISPSHSCSTLSFVDHCHSWTIVIRGPIGVPNGAPSPVTGFRNSAEFVTRWAGRYRIYATDLRFMRIAGKCKF